MSSQTSKPSFIDKIRIFIQNVKRIIRVARRPTAHEVNLIARVSGIGILIVGAVAYLLQILGTLVNQFFNPSTSSTTVIIVNIILSFGTYLPAIISNLSASPLLLTIPAGVALIVRSTRH